MAFDNEQAPVQSKSLLKPVFATRNASQKRLRKAAQLVRATPREEKSAKPNAKLAKRPTTTRTENPHSVILMAKEVAISSTMGITTTPQRSVGS
eukprot:15345090-Ditylum_brightwellii.AAC.2